MPESNNKPEITGADAHLLQSGQLTEDQVLMTDTDSSESPVTNTNTNTSENEFNTPRDALLKVFADNEVDLDVDDFSQTVQSPDEFDSEQDDTKQAEEKTSSDTSDDTNKLQLFLDKKKNASLEKRVQDLQDQVNKSKDGSDFSEAKEEPRFTKLRTALEDLGLDEEAIDGVVDEIETQSSSGKNELEEQVKSLEAQLRANYEAQQMVRALAEKYNNKDSPFDFGTMLKMPEVAQQIFGSEFLDGLNAEQFLGVIDITPYAINIIQNLNESQLEKINTEALLKMSLEHRNKHFEEFSNKSNESGNSAEPKKKAESEKTNDTERMKNVKKRLVSNSTSEQGGAIDSNTVNSQPKVEVNTPMEALKLARKQLQSRAVN